MHFLVRRHQANYPSLVHFMLKTVTTHLNLRLGKGNKTKSYSQKQYKKIS